MVKYYKRLGKELSTYLKPKHLDLVYKAYEVAREAHSTQTRQTGEPYITHPIAVASILAKMHLDYQTIMAALMHDVLEDTKMTRKEMKAQFGEEVTSLVDGVSKLTQIEFETRAEAQAENFRKMVLAMAQDIRVIIIKLADRLHNMRTLGAVSREKQARIAKETLDIYAPIANRLGMHATRLEYEELGFQAIFPMRYRVLKKAVRSARGNRKSIVSEIEANLKKCLKGKKFIPFSLAGREKHLYSIFKKMRDKHLPLSEIMDIYGFRVVVEDVDTCYRALGALHALYKPLPHRFKDYIAIPKSNGYQSLHTTLFGPYGVPVELQIRTAEMDQLAENGIAAHWLYKTSDKVTNDAQLRARQWIKGVMEMQHSSGNPLEFIENVKIDLFPDEVYVFTPRGNILELPGGATPVDFAYAVHSDIGNMCIAAKMDRKLVPLSTQLISGQSIEIITSKSARPNPNWLDFVVTGKARSNIRHFLKTRRRTESIELGKRLVLKAIKNTLPKLRKLDAKYVKTAAEAFGLKDEKELYEEVGLGKRMALVVAEQILQFMSPGDEKPVDVSENTEEALTIKGTEGLAVRYSECCQPIPGDPIVGFLAPGRGLEIHIAQCPELTKLHKFKDGDWLSVQWDDHIEKMFPVDILIEATNQPGVLAHITQQIAEVGSNINHIEAKESDADYCTMSFTITVSNRLELAGIFRQLRRRKEVVKIYRVRPKFLA